MSKIAFECGLVTGLTRRSRNQTEPLSELERRHQQPCVGITIWIDYSGKLGYNETESLVQAALEWQCYLIVENVGQLHSRSGLLTTTPKSLTLTSTSLVARFHSLP